MVDATTAILVVVRLLVLALGILITYYSFEAYRRTGTYYMRNAAIGFGIITLGVFIEGVLFEFAGVDLAVVHVIESVAIGLGFVVLLISLRR
ncbi:hypothetical protein [Halorubrum sp. CBA1229]|jgi:hypothetical protein|uniref:Uncharacterized protein n=1 Tax=Natronomonas salsuginis TaxID=2217661 RepID=A0A4U5J8S4_9EURY|nr:hypothetical protein [Halorubrum sp. CBA1229]QKY18568.1 hypothetical protein Hrr1229_016770 [Halorubrum sp. CBA1229]QKY18758.1 hypothetical protein Hrr1229_017915 [Halorubrum sp. CBA1229]TKR25114.1 hypothetical protein DM868_12235 [Natronomonas salsuginis]